MVIKAYITKQSLRRARAVFKAYPDLAFKRLNVAFKNDGFEWQARMNARFSHGGGGTKTTLGVRTGALRRSLRTHVTGSSMATLKLRVVSRGVNYALLQEFGGTIKPKNAQDLYIPLSDNKTPTGVARMSPRQAFNAGGFLYDDLKNFYLVIPGKGKGKPLKFMFILKKSVYVPPRLGFFKTWKQMRLKRERRHAMAWNAAAKDARKLRGK